ncbi:Uma2 family endonuclease [Stieleria sp. ICT_E10.1]|uniref:Uma2 family endonuclease n=1 Tax=Stieleria sedimenti TaxID=2976331 RepID=UPI0021806E0A|nr:Uma2 family endonuclease [Stieleria sedimenti]MCS7471049.1 Uma2 family endonuclease [Stieleria sedimenti]
MSLTTTQGEQRVLLRSISWQTYETLADNPDRAGRLMTYDQGLLEIMSPSMAHESDKSLLGRLVEMYSLVRGIDLASSASTTFKRPDLKRGFEADESYYIQNERRVRGKREIDLAIDPPPDLVIEIGMTRSATNKLALLASIGVPEVWRYDGETLWLGRLANDDYRSIAASEVLAGFPFDDAVATLKAVGSASETELIRRFVEKL